MEIITIVFVQVVIGAVRLVARACQAKRTREINGSLCNTCLHAHIASGFGRRKLTRCTYAWASREVNFAVSDCTMYCNRALATRLVRITGFAAREPVAAEAVARNQ